LNFVSNFADKTCNEKSLKSKIILTCSLGVFCGVLPNKPISKMVVIYAICRRNLRLFLDENVTSLSCSQNKLYDMDSIISRIISGQFSAGKQHREPRIYFYAPKTLYISVRKYKKQ